MTSTSTTGSSSSSSTTTTTINVDVQLRSVIEAVESLSNDDDKQMYMMELRKALETKFPSAMGLPSRISNNIVECIGQTKLVRINKLFTSDDDNRRGEVVGKLEFTNPGLSVKDRIAREMILDAQSDGTITPGHSVIIDITSGNTGVAYGVVAAALGYKAVQVIPEPYSIERRAMMMAAGVDVVVTRKEDGIPGAIKVYKELLIKYGDRAYAPRQFDNEANIKAHYEHTGPEIWEQCHGKIDAIVTGYGTGGSISGITKYLREKNPNFKCFAVEPMEQSHLNGDKPGPHGIQGIVPPFIPDNVVVEQIDEVIRCPTSTAMDTSRQLAKQEGIMVGISSGANVWAACQVASRPEFHNKRIVTILCSAAERYLTTPLYQSLMDEAKNLPLATFDPDTPIDGLINMNSLQSHQDKGTVFRPGFKVV